MPIQRNAGRDRNEAAQPAAQGAGRLGASRGFLTGADARAKSERVLSEQAQQIEVRAHGLDLDTINRYRFRMQEGEEADIIILDASLDHALFADEHHMKDADGRWTVFEFCPKEYDHCPLCEIDRGSSYTMFLTILDLRGFTNRQQVFVPHMKRLLAVKSNLHPEIFKLHDAAMREHKTMRGMQLLMARDGTINSSIGHPIMMNNGKLFDIVSEEDLVAEFGHAEIRDPDRENALVKAENYDITAFAYTRIFTPPTGEALRKKYGAGSAPAGSRSDVGGDWEGRETRANQSGTRMRSRTGIPPADDGGGQAHGFDRSASSPNRAAHDGPVAPGAGGGLPPRTRTRTVAPGATAPVQPGATAAPPPRTRTRSATPPAEPDPVPSQTPATPQTRPRARIQRSAAPPPGGPRGNVPNDLNTDDIPF